MEGKVSSILLTFVLSLGIQPAAETVEVIPSRASLLQQGWLACGSESLGWCWWCWFV
jgi:hypothetical protein